MVPAVLNPRLTVTMSAELKAALDDYAAHHGMSMSKAAEKAVWEMLEIPTGVAGFSPPTKLEPREKR